ncbi:hypothetical protein TL16_g12001 [Triparma laevis f. inornata]|uniref:PIN-like protein n=1 Tax=Triparma laevis f. inornata TaxID=1714386 RepID=A0A9W7BIT5_9STRA|nr:hypothetical protein TL16_g12001 [Triparma laevis f. inornata]
MFQLSYFLSSLKSVTAVLLLSLFGVFATRTERMSPASRKSIAKISSHMMLPALLIARVPQSDLTLTTLSTYWVLPFACFTYVSFGYLTSLLLCKLTKVDKHERNLILACSSLPTSTGPILALYAAVLTALPSETNLDKDAALASGAAQILIYTAFMNILRWTIGWELMKKPDEIVERGEDDMVAMVDLSVNRSSKPNSTPSSTTKQLLYVALKKQQNPP